MSTRISKLVTVAAALFTAGCAASPHTIAPTPVSEAPYREWSCDQLAEEQARLATALGAASTQQERTAGNDALGVLLIGVPVSSLSGGDKSVEIARLKGEGEAVEKVSTVKQCPRRLP